MQLARVISVKGIGDITVFLKKNKTLLILTVFYLIGFFIGIVSHNAFKGFYDFFCIQLKSFITLRDNSSFFKIFFSSVNGYSILIVLCFIFGSSILGIVFLPFILGFSGFYYGGIMALLYAEYSLKGIAFSAVMVLPSAVIFAVSLILAAGESVGFSIRVAKLTLPKTHPANLYYDFKNYCGRYIFIMLLMLLAALTDSFISSNISESFFL